MKMDKTNCAEDNGGLSTNIYTFNVRGLRDNLKRQRLFTYFRNKMKGIIYLQETHSVESDLEKWKKEWQGEMYISSGTSQSKGTAILIAPNIDYAIDKTEIDKQGRYVMLTGTFNGHNLCLLNVYAPTADKKNEQLKFLDQIIPLLENNTRKMILAGDLNTHLASEDKHGDKYIETEFAKKLTNQMQEYGLTDIWRINNPDYKRYTWRRVTCKGISQSRLDYFLISESLTYLTTKCEIQHALYSDHNPVHLQISSENENKRGRGFWKLNTSLLRDNNYIKLINELIDKETPNLNKLEDKGLMWDTFKMLIRSSTISYASNKAKKTRE
jgi:exonuclease III